MPRRDATSKRSRHRSAGDKNSLDNAYVEAIADDDEPTSDNAKQLERKPLGNGWTKVEIDPAGMQAILRELSFGGDPTLEAADLRKSLAETYLLNFGLNDKLVEQLAEQACAARGEVIQGQFPVALGTPPVPGEDGRLAFSCITDEEATMLPFAKIKKALEQRELETVVAQHLPTCLVAPGQDIAAFVPPTDGQPGKDVFGKTSQSPGEPVAVEAGENVKEVADRFIAEAFGYLCLLQDKISVLSPLWVAPDLMSAHLIYFPQEKGWPRPKIEWLQQNLDAVGVTHGQIQSCLENLSRQNIDTDAPVHFLLAEGTPAVPGNDAHIKYAFNPDQKAGKILDDGSIDLKDRNAAVSAAADQVLGEVVPATAGRAGSNICSAEIATTDGEDRDFEAGENVRCETSEGVEYFVAEIEGVVLINGDTLSVCEVFYVNGDVDYQTGNIDVGKAVEISGCVRSGFSVKAGGSIVIGGLVEDGAQLIARGDITVSQGIFGESTRVIGLGDLECKFIQNSSVIVRRNIVVGSYIYNAQVSAGGHVQVKSGGGERGGSIVGGELVATQGVQARLLGSSTTAHTVVGVGANPEDNARQKKLKKVVDHCDVQILRLLRTLGLREFKHDRIKRLIAKAPPSRRPLVIDAIKKLNELVATREKTSKEQENLASEILRQLGKGHVKVSETAYAGVQIRYGEIDLTLSADLERPTFYLEEDGRIRQRLYRQN